MEIRGRLGGGGGAKHRTPLIEPRQHQDDGQERHEPDHPRLIPLFHVGQHSGDRGVGYHHEPDDGGEPYQLP